ncbi:MAG: HEPN domain-containing protein [Planctomycetaceae bacterium]
MAADDPDVLIRKAKQDELVLERLLGDQDVDDDTLGFHAQQAAEKLLKAAMAIRGLDYPRTHDLGALIDMLAKGGTTLPEDLADIDLLTPFGTIFRYDEVVERAGRDRQQWLGWIRSLRSLVTAMKS